MSDLARIVGHIRDALTGSDPAAAVCMDREDAETILRALAERDAALAPFAETANDFPAAFSDGGLVVDGATGLTLGDLRRARDILGKG